MGTPPSTTRRNALIGIVVIAVGAVGWWFARRTAPEDISQRGFGAYAVSDTKSVYYGNATMFRRPAVVTADVVYAQIPEYQEIRRRGLGDGQPEYHLLLQKASARFAAAVKAMADAQDHDFVAERGTIRARRPDAPAPPDRTQEVLAELR